MELPDYLSQNSRYIAEEIGLDGLMRLVKRYGGLVIRVSEKSDLKETLTEGQYKHFLHIFRNEKLFIPRLQAKENQLTKAETQRLAQQGMTRAAIARKLCVTERTVYNRLSSDADENDKHQGDIFK